VCNSDERWLGVTFVVTFGRFSWSSRSRAHCNCDIEDQLVVQLLWRGGRPAAIGEAERNAHLLFHGVTNNSNPVWPRGDARLSLDEGALPLLL
jgi:hypothetical protein